MISTSASSFKEYAHCIAGATPHHKSAAAFDVAIVAIVHPGFRVPLVARLLQLQRHHDLFKDNVDNKTFVLLLTSTECDEQDMPAVAVLLKVYSTESDTKRIGRTQMNLVSTELKNVLMECSSVHQYIEYTRCFEKLSLQDAAANDEVRKIYRMCHLSDEMKLQEFQLTRTALANPKTRIGKPLDTWSVGKELLKQWESQEH